jgi:hypothetical protein
LGFMITSSPLLGSPAMTKALTATIAFILLAANFTITNAQPLQQQQLTSPTGEIRNTTTSTATAATTFQSTNDSFSIQVPDGWVIQDLNNTSSALLNESSQGYGILAQLCPEEEQQQQGAVSLRNASGGSPNSNISGSGNSCQGAQQVIHIIRYPNLETRIQPANNVTAYHLQKLQEVGYSRIQTVNSTATTVNITNPHTNETIATMPGKFVEMAYSTNSATNETRNGYFILTATAATDPDVGTIKGYAVFYEGNSNTSTTAATPEITTTTSTAASDNLEPALPPAVALIFDSFELIAAPEAVQALGQQTAVGQTQGGATTGGDLNCEDITERNFAIDPNNDPNGFDGDNDGIGCETGARGEVTEGEGEGGGAACDSSYPDTCIPSPPPDLNCDDVSATDFRVEGSDPHDFDRDNDGIGCESGGGAPEDSSEDVDDDDGGGGDTSCHPSYPDNCIPPPPPNLNCDDVSDTDFEVVGSDPHGFDRDNDGIGCESGSGVPDDDDDSGNDDDGGEEPEPEPGDGDDDGEGGEGEGGNEGGDDDGAGEGENEGGEGEGGGDEDGAEGEPEPEPESGDNDGGGGDTDG